LKDENRKNYEFKKSVKVKKIAIKRMRIKYDMKKKLKEDEMQMYI
jgi:hypothetical protein